MSHPVFRNDVAIISFRVYSFATPIGVTAIPGMRGTQHNGIGKAQPLDASLSIDFIMNSSFSHC